MVALLLLKAAAPMLASASALAQGRSVVEVCTVYGVSTRVIEADADAAPARGDRRDDAPGAHHGQPCVLSALAACAGPAMHELHVPAATPAPALAGPLQGAPATPGACARWLAQRHHAPPPHA